MYWGFGDCLWVYRYVSMSFRGSVVLRGCVWGLSPCRIQSGWRQTNQFSTTKKGEIVFSWRLIDIKISKPPLVSFPKMVGFYHFLRFWHLSQRNYNWQSFWITLYHKGEKIVNNLCGLQLWSKTDNLQKHQFFIPIWILKSGQINVKYIFVCQTLCQNW